MLPYNKKLKQVARKLRKKMTGAETHLWGRIRRKQLKGYQFYRQRVVGHYIVDFYCPAAKLVIEVDGGQHYSEEAKRKDRIRDDFLAGLGLTVLRFSDREVLKDTEAVLTHIYEHL
jgi:very-short-patch-repair endonuclease